MRHRRAEARRCDGEHEDEEAEGRSHHRVAAEVVAVAQVNERRRLPSLWSVRFGVLAVGFEETAKVLAGSGLGVGGGK